MKRCLGALCALLLCSGVLAPARAQESDAFVLRPGQARLRVSGIFSDADSRFGADSTEALGAGLRAALTASTFAPLRPVAAALQQFLDGTQAQTGGSVGVGPETVTLGTPDLRLTANTRTVPIRLDVGVLPRLEVGVMLPLQQSELVLRRLALTGATMGINPAPDTNAALLAELDPRWAALGAAMLLPTDSSALGRELQRRVRALGGAAELGLPRAGAADSTAAATLNALLAGELGIPPLASRVSDMLPGDVELGARFQLFSTLGSRPLAADSAGVGFRGALSLGVRLPTGVAATDSVFLLSADLPVGQTGALFGFDGDLFSGRRFWGTVSARYTHLVARDVTRRVADPAAPLGSLEGARTVRLTPGDELEVRVIPRYRLTEEIALGAHYALLRAGAASYAEVGGAGGEFPASVLDAPARTVQMLGWSARYSTLPAVSAGRGALPLEVVLSYATSVAGSGDALRASTLLLQASVYRQLWGRR